MKPIASIESKPSDLILRRPRSCAAVSKDGPTNSLVAVLRDARKSALLRVRLIITAHFSGPCEATRKHANACEHDPRLCAGDCLLEILGEATTAVEPGQGPFNHPAFRLSLESADTLRSCDDLNGPWPQFGDRVEQLVAAVDAVGEDMPQPGERVAELFQQRHRAVIVLDIGWVHLQDQQRTDRVGDNVTV